MGLDQQLQEPQQIPVWGVDTSADRSEDTGKSHSNKIGHLDTQQEKREGREPRVAKLERDRRLHVTGLSEQAR